MVVLYFDKLEKKLHKWNEDLLQEFSNKIIKENNPLCMEYKKFRILSNKFRLFGKNEIAITNNIRTTITKDIAPENIIYYDKDVRPVNLDLFVKVLNIDVFDPSEYGNSIFYYTSSYQNNRISLCTKFYGIDEGNFLTRGLSNVFNLVSKMPMYGAYFNLTGDFISGIGNIINRLTYKVELIENSVIEFRDEDMTKPFIYGSYICIPEITEIDKVISDFIVVDDTLVKISDNKEFIGSYYIIEVTDNHNEYLFDFDFTYNCNDILNSINKYEKRGIETFVATNKDANDFHIIQQLVSLSTDPQRSVDEFKSLYHKLSINNRRWFNENFTHIKYI